MVVNVVLLLPWGCVVVVDVVLLPMSFYCCYCSPCFATLVDCDEEDDVVEVVLLWLLMWCGVNVLVVWEIYWDCWLKMSFKDVV